MAKHAVYLIPLLFMSSALSAEHSETPPFYMTSKGKFWDKHGDKGTMGRRGHKGDRGKAGKRGDRGRKGTHGVQGEQGVAGQQGVIGPQGPQGVVGLQGNQGPQGAQGQQGPQGIVGLTGDTGFQGANGAQGATGATGTSFNPAWISIWGQTGLTPAPGNQVLTFDAQNSENNATYNFVGGSVKVNIAGVYLAELYIGPYIISGGGTVVGEIAQSGSASALQLVAIPSGTVPLPSFKMMYAFNCAAGDEIMPRIISPAGTSIIIPDTSATSTSPGTTNRYFSVRRIDQSGPP